MEYYIIGFIALIISLLAQVKLSYTYRQSKKISTNRGMSGAEVAREILANHGLNDIYVVETNGVLTDHYDSSRKVVRLSTDVYNNTSIASVSVAAHEVGHAIQDKEKYFFMKLRSLIFPLASIGSKLAYVVIMIGLFSGMLKLFYFGIILLSAILAFQLVTLPVEYNASSKARNELLKLNILDNNEIKSSNKMLKAAALTYVAGVLTTILEILRLLLMARDD